jgi:hypothetical protein
LNTLNTLQQEKAMSLKSAPIVSLISLSIAAAGLAGCVPETIAYDGTGGTAGTTGQATSTGGATAATGGQTAATGGATAATGGQTAATGGATVATGGQTAATGGAAGAAAQAHNALRFSVAAKSYVQVDNFTVPHDFTLEAWIKPASAGEEVILAKEKQGTNANQFRFGLTSAGMLYFTMSDSNGEAGGLWTTSTSYQLISSAPVPVDTWTHVAVTRYGFNLNLLIDGTSVKTFTLSADVVHSGTDPLRIGASLASVGTSAGSEFDGIVDEVRVFAVARSAAQIQAGRMRPIDSSDPQWADLAAYWRFDEGSGTVTADLAVAGGHTGTLVNGPVWVTSDAF